MCGVIFSEHPAFGALDVTGNSRHQFLRKTRYVSLIEPGRSRRPVRRFRGLSSLTSCPSVVKHLLGKAVHLIPLLLMELLFPSQGFGLRRKLSLRIHRPHKWGEQQPDEHALRNRMVTSHMRKRRHAHVLQRLCRRLIKYPQQLRRLLVIALRHPLRNFSGPGHRPHCSSHLGSPHASTSELITSASTSVSRLTSEIGVFPIAAVVTSSVLRM